MQVDLALVPTAVIPNQTDAIYDQINHLPAIAGFLHSIIDRHWRTTLRGNNLP